MSSFTAFFRRLPVRTWLLLGAFLLFWKLNYAPLWNPDEGRYASAALEMAQPFDATPADWTIPRLNTVPRLNKPPLVYWLGAASYKGFGASEAAARLVPALASLAVMLGIYFLGRTMFGERSGVAGALVWTTAIFSAAMARTFNTDMLLCASMFFVFGGLFLAGEAATCRYSRIRPYLWSGLGMGLAMLAKGPVGVALPLLLGAIYLTLALRWKRVSLLGVLAAFALAALIGAPWYFAVEARVPGFAKRFLLEENLGRFSGKAEFHDPTPFWYYLPVVLLGMLPWPGFLLAALARTRAFFDWRKADDSFRARLFLWIWALGLVGFFSLSSTKLISYVLPAFPAFALLVGESIGGKEEWSPLIRRAALLVGALLSLVIAVAATIYLTNEKTLPAAEGLFYAIAAAVILLAGVIAAWIFRSDRWKVFGAQSLCATALLVTLLSLAGRVAPYEDASPMIKAILPHLRSDDVFVEYRTFQPTAIFYAARPVPIYEFTNNSGLDEKHPNYAKVFRPGAEAAQLNALSQRAFALVRWNHDDTKLFVKWHLLARNNDFRLYSNRPAPTGFAYDFTAPGKRNR